MSTAAEVVPSWRLLQENRLMMEAATRLVAERALAVTLSGTPSNPPRALAFQMQKRLGLMSLPKVELVMPGMAVASMSNVEDYLAVTANPTIKLCKLAPHARERTRGSVPAVAPLTAHRPRYRSLLAQTAQPSASTALRFGSYWARARASRCARVRVSHSVC